MAEKIIYWRLFWKVRITIRGLSDVQISYGLVKPIIKEDLGMGRVPARFVPKPLSAHHKDPGVSIAKDLLDSFENHENILKDLHKS